jgi:hypothetical protein
VLCRHVLVGAAELAALRVELTIRADALADQADRIVGLERAIADHRTASLLAIDDTDCAAADDRLWGAL